MFACERLALRRVVRVTRKAQQGRTQVLVKGEISEFHLLRDSVPLKLPRYVRGAHF